MASYEIQADGSEGWEVIEEFDEFDTAFECAKRLEREGRYENLRVLKESFDLQSNLFRQSTVYRGGERVREAQAHEIAHDVHEAATNRRRKRRKRKVLVRWAKQRARSSARTRVETRPINIFIRVTTLFFIALFAAYYFDDFPTF